jgi:hypothetical protein
MTEEKLKEIEAGLDRWNVCSPAVAKLLIAEVRRLSSSLSLAMSHLDEARGSIERAQRGGR